MELGRPLAVITPTLDGDVLRVLALADADFTPGQVQGLLGERSVAGVRRCLDRLAEQGIATRRSAGRAFLFGLNREHLAAEPVIALARARDRLLDRLANAVSDWSQPPIYGAVFGSATTPQHRPDSDLDLLLVSPFDTDPDLWQEQTTALARDATAWTGNDARVLSFTARELETHADETVLTDAARDGLRFVGEPGWLRSYLRDRATRTHR